MKHYIGVDVGSGSVRAGVFDANGRCVAHQSAPISRWRPRPGFVEQSSDEIWRQCVVAVRGAVERSAVEVASIRAIGFDATCSLVAVDREGRPVSISPDDDDRCNVIMWMDHRAVDEAREIAATGHPALDHVGGEVSPELELPKLLWMKRNRPDQFARADYYLDLADYMVFHATGVAELSACTLVCKWLYLAHEGRWPKDLLDQIGLDELYRQPYLEQRVLPLGSPAGTLAPAVAAELGLSPATVVATGIIDAHAGALGMLGESPEGRLAIIGGTSACHIALSAEPRFVPGVWGPYFGAVLPDAWINEGGQSAVGALIDYVLEESATWPELRAEAERQGVSHFDLLNQRVARLEAEERWPTRHLHLLGYHHGNRSPRADPSLRGMLSGLTLEQGLDELARRYLATLQSIAYGTLHIIEALEAQGHVIERLAICGGALKNPLWLRELADVTGRPIELPGEPETVMLGAAMLAAAAAGDFPSLREAARGMFSAGGTIEPRAETRGFHAAKYRVFHQLYLDQLHYRELMAECDG
ncbi:FGGY-family carbohydrate kinase [Halotalea alkalilenta]|uniref:FGGY-family carbohydrate kinase n=1 Tax=Halotalea alkalilenta TaxID=376489 RepID=UPI0004882A9A|nr:FGGY-family carbohydrate kinase [Halotalea alkalilenta]